jgi:hypothetical protein
MAFEMEGRIMRTRILAVKVAVAVVALMPLTGGVAKAGGNSVSDFVHWTMDQQEQKGGCEWGRQVSAAAGDNRQDTASHRPDPCK